MSGYDIIIDVSDLIRGIDAEVERKMQRLSEAVEAAAATLKSEWMTAVFHARGIHQGEKNLYADSLTIERPDPLNAVIVAGYEHAQAIESGRPAQDLKRMLQTSIKTRLGRNGKYLVIPFQHNTTGHSALAPDMPKDVYARAKRLSPSYLLPLGTKKPALRRSASGHLVPQRSYEWGGRLPAGMLGPNPKGKVDRYAGMVRMNTSAGKAKSSEFLTFRTNVKAKLKCPPASQVEMSPQSFSRLVF
jgi:hypothetical protein